MKCSGRYNGKQFGLALIPESHQSFAIADSTDAVQAWISDKLPTSISNYSYSSGQFPVNSFSTTPRTFPMDRRYTEYVTRCSLLGDFESPPSAQKPA
jgi:hypothetical protein